MQLVQMLIVCESCLYSLQICIRIWYYAEHVKYLWLTADDGSNVKVYEQKRPVEYADYKSGMLYVSVYEVFPHILGMGKHKIKSAHQ